MIARKCGWEERQSEQNECASEDDHNAAQLATHQKSFLEE
jgi:hypothetical protein